MARTESNPLLTSESAVYSVDSPENHTAASLLNPAGCSFHSAPALSDGRGWTSELRTEEAQLISDNLHQLNLNKE
ncbi:hypothetical protein L3Q82_008477 [Scortum barcoo]|uniref:Uncharacterized protein n=1 Tax=Scortum barcoo TaxID=214431 RepID=A0ACB8XE91_9TELE|nr:hypothetical protein L3Q82_008477 [Scortum barcoo]